MKNKLQLEVYMEDKLVGKLAQTKDYRIAFQYSANWIREGFSISPFSLPLNNNVFIPKSYEPFEGIFGVFSDSLPDGWGRLLVDRFLLKNKINPDEISPLTRLAIVGNSGMGALEYRPVSNIKYTKNNLPIDELAKECQKILDDKDSSNLDEIFILGGSSGGARPKINIKIKNEEWIIKFPSREDHKDIGIEEYEYSMCAKKCGIIVPQVKLIDSKICSGYFATKRFDRNNGKKVHMVSVSGLLETSHRLPSLDYNTLLKLTHIITNNFEEVKKLFKLMCFNIFSHNRDDHSKNFSFLFENNCWKLSPAYDLTYSNSIGGEHATTINGNGKNPNLKDILEVARVIGISESKAKSIALEVNDIVSLELKKYI